MSERGPNPRRPRRRLFAVSMRTLMILILIIGAPLGWKANRARTRKAT